MLFSFIFTFLIFFFFLSFTHQSWKILFHTVFFISFFLNIYFRFISSIFKIPSSLSSLACVCAFFLLRHHILQIKINNSASGQWRVNRVSMTEPWKTRGQIKDGQWVERRLGRVEVGGPRKELGNNGQTEWTGLTILY